MQLMGKRIRKSLKGYEVQLFPWPIKKLPENSYLLEIPAGMFTGMTNEIILRVYFKTVQGGGVSGNTDVTRLVTSMRWYWLKLGDEYIGVIILLCLFL